MHYVTLLGVLFMFMTGFLFWFGANDPLTGAVWIVGAILYAGLMQVVEAINTSKPT